MCNFWLKYGLYGCILGLMGRKIWARAHEESKINLRPVFQPDSSGRTLSPVDSYQNIQDNFYQNIQPVGYTYATRQLIRDQADAARAVADYRRAHGSCNAAAVRTMPLRCATRVLFAMGGLTLTPLPCSRKWKCRPSEVARVPSITM